MSSLELITCMGMIFMSGFLSASEVALFSLTRFQIRYLRDHFNHIHRRIKFLLSDPGSLLITILVSNELVNVTFATIVANVIARSWGTEGFILPSPITTLLATHIPAWAIQTVLGILFTTPIVLIFCEITPKVAGARANQVVATFSVGGLTFLHSLLLPVRLALNYLIRLVGAAHPSEAPLPSESKLKEQEFIHLAEEGHREGHVRETELDLIKSVFQLDDIPVEKVYVPMNQVFTIPKSMSLKDAIKLVPSKDYSRVPVIDPNKGNRVVGILHTINLINSKLNPDLANHSVETVMFSPFFVDSSIPLSSLFRRLKMEKTHMAIVTNSLGDPIGIVTMTAILDELFEE